MELMALREAMSTMPPPNISRGDKILWDSYPKFSVKEAWDAIRDHHPQVPWCAIVWFKSHILRHSFILWLAVHQRLSTQDRLRFHGLQHPSRCLLCGHAMESHSHLFFHCSYTERLWFELLRKLGLQCRAHTWDDVLQWSIVHFSGSSLLHLLGRLGFAALVYFIWRERNARIHDHTSMDAGLLMKQVESVVRLRLVSCKPFARTEPNRHLVQVWALPPSVLNE